MALPEREREDAAPAKRYANLEPGACAAELERRRLPVKPARGKTPGLASPLQLVGPLRKVAFELPRSVYGFLDCRLVLLLDDLAADLVAHGVVSVVVNNVYRPRSKLPGRPAQSSQHALGLAVDINAFRLADGSVLNVEQDWHGTMGVEPCGPKSRVIDEHAAGIKLRSLTCAIARAGYCNHLITPSRDQAHANHLHCDIEAGAHEVMVE